MITVPAHPVSEHLVQTSRTLRDVPRGQDCDGFAPAQHPLIRDPRPQLGTARPPLRVDNVESREFREPYRALRGLCAADTVPWLDTRFSAGYLARSGGTSGKGGPE